MADSQRLWIGLPGGNGGKIGCYKESFDPLLGYQIAGRDAGTAEGDRRAACRTGPVTRLVPLVLVRSMGLECRKSKLLAWLGAVRDRPRYDMRQG